GRLPRAAGHRPPPDRGAGAAMSAVAVVVSLGLVGGGVLAVLGAPRMRRPRLPARLGPPLGGGGGSWGRGGWGGPGPPPGWTRPFEGSSRRRPGCSTAPSGRSLRFRPWNGGSGRFSPVGPGWGGGGGGG